MSVDPTPVQVGDVYRLPHEAMVSIMSVNADASVADVEIMHLGASWPETVPLVDGCFPYPADLVAGVSL